MSVHTSTATSPTTSPSSRQSLWSRVRRFVREVIGELGAVTWPTYAQTVRDTAIVLVFLAITVAIIGAADAGIATVISKVFG